MGESSDEIERHIREIRHDLGNNLNELEYKVKSAFDWRAQFEERPGTMLALAFAGGVLLSGLLSSGTPSRRRSQRGGENLQSMRGEPALTIRPRAAYNGKASQPSEIWSAVRLAVAGIVAAKLSEFIEELLPGFRTDTAKGQSGRAYSRPGSSSGQPRRQKPGTAVSD
jgi:hypothetical protein